MKNKLILSKVIAVLLLSSGMYGAQKPSEQSWGDWFRAKIRSYTGVDTQKLGYSVSKNILPSDAIGIALGTVGGGLLLSNEEDGNPPLGLYLLGTMIGTSCQMIIDVIRNYNDGLLNKGPVISKIKDALRISVLYNDLTYPTPSSKIHVLLKKDEFLAYMAEYVEDKHRVLDEACNQLIGEVNGATKSNSYTERQKKEDQAIDAYMNVLQKQPVNVGDLAEKIALLQTKLGEQDSIVKMRGYLSLYYRFKNQLEVRKSVGQQGWKYRVEKEISLLSEDDKKVEDARNVEKAWRYQQMREKMYNETQGNLPK